MTRAPLLAATLLAVAASAAQADCLSDAAITAMADAYMAGKPAANPDGLNQADGECSRAKLHKVLGPQLGKVIGYKAGLTNPAVQKRFNANAPVWGLLYANMLLPDGSLVDANFGARPLYEADLLVRVSSEAINRARSAAEVLESVDQIIPFIELPDLVVEAPPKLNGAAITAINVGARLGIEGKPIPVPVTRAERLALLDALRDMVVVLKADGVEVDRGKGSDVLDHPLNAVLWLAADIRRDNRSLKVGDLISLGSFSRLLPPKPGLKVSAEYQGLPGNPSVGVHFK